MNLNPIIKYINKSSKDTKPKLELMYKTIKDIAPKTDELIAYGMPTFKLNGKNLVHFGGFKKHVGFFPTPKGIVKFKKEENHLKKII
jgi:uncharacterized protein YdhG (YjbR/CyaY superfamily)